MIFSACERFTWIFAVLRNKIVFLNQNYSSPLTPNPSRARSSYRNGTKKPKMEKKKQEKRRMAEREIIETKFSGLRKRGCSSNNSDGDNETNHPVPFLEAFTMLQPLTTPRCCDSFFILRITTIYFNRMNRISRARRRLKKYHTQTHTHTVTKLNTSIWEIQSMESEPKIDWNLRKVQCKCDVCAFYFNRFRNCTAFVIEWLVCQKNKKVGVWLWVFVFVCVCVCGRMYV